jgi:adenylosuccinate synthase
LPLSIIVGGQYGSEGKGKVAQQFARWQRADAVVRVGGTNSGHTTLGEDMQRRVLRQLPTVAVDFDPICVLAAGSYIDLEVLMAEIRGVGLAPERLVIDPNAMIITAEDRRAEQHSDLGERIGSTCSGTGETVLRRIRRRSAADLAAAQPELERYLAPVGPRLREILERDGHVVIEGTQGFGLSLIHSRDYPHVTSRDTTAAGALAEAGLSPLDVSEIVLVLRSFPIRVAGTSGLFHAPETDWETIALEGGHERDLSEHTSVTKRLRRVGRFDPAIVREAIAANNPSAIVLNHLDLVDAAVAESGTSERAIAFVDHVQQEIGRAIDFVGLGPDRLIAARELHRVPV